VRTTLSLDDDVAALLNREVRKSGEPFKQVVNRAIRAGLTTPAQPGRKPFKVKPFDLGVPHFEKVQELLEYLEGPEYR
jgi:hypothetical protein